MIRVLTLLSLTALSLTGLPLPVRASPEATARFGTAEAATVLDVHSTTDIANVTPALQAFVARNPDVAVAYEQWGSNALYREARAQCDSGAGAPDVVISSAVHQMVQLVNEACASPHRSPQTEALPETRRWRDEIWGVTHEPVVMIYNTDRVPAADVPRTRFKLLDLLRRGDARYRGRIATYDIEASGSGYLLAFADSLEATTFGALLEGLARNDAIATCCSAEIINDVASGKFLIGYNILGAYLTTAPIEGVGVIQAEDYTLFLSRGYMIPRSAAHKQAAARLLDFLLTPEGRDRLREGGLIVERDPDVSALPESSERGIEIDPTLLIALDQQRRASFVAQWRSVFGPAEPGP